MDSNEFVTAERLLRWMKLGQQVKEFMPRFSRSRKGGFRITAPCLGGFPVEADTLVEAVRIFDENADAVADEWQRCGEAYP